MAQAIRCDIQGEPDHLADVLVSQIANGDTTAWCFTHYVAVCQAVLDSAAEAEAQAAQAAQEAADRLAGSAPGPGEVSGPETPEAEPGAPSPSPEPADGSGGAEGDQPDQEGLGGQEAGDRQEAAPEPA